MDERQIKLIVGTLLHDIGKVVYYSGNEKNHSQRGYEFLKNELKIDDNEILDQIRFHHCKMLNVADIENDSFAYITYIADNIASMANKTENELEDNGFDKNMPLESIFNKLNGNNQHCLYKAKTLDDGINYPLNEIENEEKEYIKIQEALKNNIKDLNFSEEYINSLIETMERYLTYVSSCINLNGNEDISLYDHVKVTAAISSCIYEYLKYNNIKDYKTELFINAESFYDKNVFLLCSMDISGIQNFIYTISSKDAQNMLRARSFYLEILMEHVIDELLHELELSRVNRLYAGGGHCYLVLPNTGKAKTIIETFERKIKEWLLEYFKTDLYIAFGTCECSANEINNKTEGQYRNIFNTISSEIAKKKTNRYTYAQILKLNEKKKVCGNRECKICKRVDLLNNDDRCIICDNLIKMSPSILIREKNDNNFFCITNSSEKLKGSYLPLPNGKFFTIVDAESIQSFMKSDMYVRCYCKNNAYKCEEGATKIWVADYTSGNTFEELAKDSMGIERIAVLRADIDNLGQAFVSGFKDKEGKDTNSSISRTATFSRQLSLFFKHNINEVLENGSFSIANKSGKRKITVVYSGGDDMFVVGSWDEVIGFSVDLYKAIKRYTQGTLTISAGIGMFHEKTPVSVMASYTGLLEDLSKGLTGKNAVTLFNGESTFKWEELINNVIGEKFNYIKEFLDDNSEKGKGFLYKLLVYIRNKEDKINLARFAYLLGRLEPEKKNDKDFTEKYKEFKTKLYDWILNDKDCRELVTAIYLYVYSIRDKEDDNNEA